jgi:hypothetical protein
MLAEDEVSQSTGHEHCFIWYPEMVELASEKAMNNVLSHTWGLVKLRERVFDI